MFYNTIKTNFHTHTIFCGHAVGLPIDYLEKIKQYGIKTIGFSEHAYIDVPRFHHTIKSLEHMDAYYNEVDKLRTLTDSEVLIGLEVDYIPSFMDYYKELHKKFDYLTLSIHFVILNNEFSYGTRFTLFDEMKLYGEYMESGMASNLFSFVNHPDLFLNQQMNEYKDNDEIIKIEMGIINNAIKYNIPLEFNIAQFKRYNDLYKDNNIRDDFWTRVGKSDAKVIINFDAHNPEEINLDIYNLVLSYVKKHNLKIIDDFRGCK